MKEIQKLSGLGWVTCSSGKHKGEKRISHRDANGSDIGCSRQPSSSNTFGGIQGTPHVFYDKARESTQEDAVADCNSVQAAKSNLYDSEEGNEIQSKKRC